MIQIIHIFLFLIMIGQAALAAIFITILSYSQQPVPLCRVKLIK